MCENVIYYIKLIEKQGGMFLIGDLFVILCVYEFY